MKFVMTQAVCPEGMQLLDGIADVYISSRKNRSQLLRHGRAMWHSEP